MIYHLYNGVDPFLEDIFPVKLAHGLCFVA